MPPFRNQHIYFAWLIGEIFVGVVPLTNLDFSLETHELLQANSSLEFLARALLGGLGRAR